MNIYLAGCMGVQLELRGEAEKLQAQGHTIVSDWLYDNHPFTPGGIQEVNDWVYREMGEANFQDLSYADVVVVFNRKEQECAGGHHVELGIALGLHLPILLIGERQNPFHYVPLVHYYKEEQDWHQDPYLQERPGDIRG